MKRKSPPRIWNPLDLLRTRKAGRGKPARRTFVPALERLESRLAPANVDVLRYHYNLPLTGQNLQETVLRPGPAGDPAAVNATNFGTLFSVPIDGQAYAQPLYKADLPIPGMGTRNVAFIATEHDSVYAFDADTGAQLWHNSYIDPARGITTIPYAELSTPDLFPEIGITGTPVIDADTSTLYVVVKTKEVRTDGGVHYVQKLHALDLATGAEKFNGPYQIGDTHVASPGATPVFANETTAIMVPGSGGETSGGANPMVPFSAERESNRMALQLVGNIVYVAFASHADFRPYHGWVIGFDKTTLQPVKVFNTSPNADGIGIWESGGGLSFDEQGFMYFAVGNGFAGPFPAFDPAHGNYSESVLKIDTTPNWSPADPQMMRVADYFTPFNWQTLDAQDADLGSGGVMLLPDSVGSAAHPHLMVETGKQGVIYLIDRDDMGGFTAGGPDRVVQRVTAGQTGVWGNPAFFQLNPTTGIIYYHGSNDVLKGYTITNGHIDDAPASIMRSLFNSLFPGTQPTVSADGTADPLNPVNGIVWELQVDNAIGRIQGVGDRTTAGPATLRAFSATNLGVELYDSRQAGQRDFSTGSVKFTVPVVTNGHVLVAGADHFAVFGLFPAALGAPAAPSNLAAQAQSPATGPQIQLTWTNPAPSPGFDPTGIKIFRSTDGTTFTQIDTVNRNLTTYTDVGPFQIGQQLFYRVVAANQAGDSDPSNTVSASIPIPAPVLTVTGTTSSSISLSWTGLANDHFAIERSTDGTTFTPVASVPGSQTAYTDTGLAMGLYAYRIHAFNVNPSAEALSNVRGAWVGPTIDHGTPATGGFINTTDLTINGSAGVITNLLELTNAPGQAGSAFSNTRFAVANFTTTFDVRLHEGTQPDYADGFTFVLQANGPAALGSAAAGIGYQGIGRSVAVVFSTFQHAGDPSSSSVGLALNGAAPGTRVDTTPSGLLLNSQSIKHIVLNYDGTALMVQIEDILTHEVFTTSFPVNIAQVIGSDTAYVGLTGASGSAGFWELEDVLSWTFTSQAPLPGAPSNLRVAASTSSGLDLAWDGNSFNETGFQVERSTDGTNFTLIATTTRPSYRDAGSGSGTFYYRVRAVNGAGSSPYSNTLQTSVPAPILTLHQDVGTPGNPSIAGNATFSNGIYTLTASGSDIWDTADHFHFLYAPLTGDGEIIARVLTLQTGVHDFAKAGVMFRESLAAGAANAYMLQFPNPGSRPGWPTYQWRAGTGGASMDHEFQVLQRMPLWLRLVRSGSTFIGYWAVDMDGTPGAWNQLGAETVVMGTTAYVGLAVTSHNNSATVTATFDRVQIVPAVEITSHLDVSASAPLVNPGTPINITVRALDQFNNVVTGYRGTVHFTSSDPLAELPADYTFTEADNGVHTFTNVILRTVGGQTVTATDTVSGTVDGATVVTVSTSPIISALLVAGFPSSIHAGVAGTVTVTARDAMGVVVAGYRGTVHFTSSDPRAQLPADYTFTAADAGVHTFSITLNTAGTQSITATDTTAMVSGTQSNIVVAAPVAVTSVNHSAFVINEGGSLTLSGQFSDSLAGQAHTAVIAWGDGSADTTLSLVTGVFTFSSSHTYLEEGNFAIQVTVRAADGSSDTVALPVVPDAVSPPPGLAAWWTGDGSSLTTAPDLAGTNPGTLNGGVSYAPGQVGNAFSFNGASSRTNYVNVPDAPSLNSTTGTWDFWVRTTQSGSFVGFVGKADASVSRNGLIMQMDPNGLPRLEIKNNTQTTLLTGTTRLNDGQWHHFALTFQSAGPMIMYVDGQVQATGTAPAFTFNPNPLRFGTQLDTFWAPYNGLLDEVQIYNRVLSAAEIQAIFNAGSAGLVKGVRVLDVAVVPVGGFTVTATAGADSGPQTVAVFTDPAGPEALTDYSASINWGDGTAPSAGTISLNAATGLFTVQGSHLYAQVGRYTVTVTIRHDTAPDATATSAAVVFAPVLRLTGFPSVTVAGTPGSFTVTVQDPFGGKVAGYRGTVHFTSSDPRAELPADYTFTAEDAGTHTFSATLKTAGNQSLTAADTMTPDLAGTQGGIVVTPAAASSFTVTDFPSPTTAGALGAVLVTARDAFGNVATGYQGTVHLSSSDPQAQLAGDHTFTAEDAGRFAFGAVLRTAGTQSITATDVANPDLTGTQAGIVVTPAALAGLALSGFPAEALRSGVPVAFTVTARDAFGNAIPDYRGTVSFSSSDPRAVLPAGYTFTASDGGVHAFIVTFETSGTRSLTVADTAGGLTATQGDITVIPFAFEVTGFPSPVTAGSAGTFTVRAVDAAGNTDTGYTGTVHLTSSDPQATLPRDYAFTAADQGVHLFGAVLRTAGTQSITAADTAAADLTGMQAGVVVHPSPTVGSFLVTGFPATVAGTPGGFTVTALDPFGNVAVGYTGTVVFSSSDPLASLPAAYTFTADDQGTHSFSATLYRAGAQSITVTDVATGAAGTEADIQITPAAAAALLLSTATPAVNAGDILLFTVTAVDAYGNPGAAYLGTVHFSSSDPLAALPDDYTFVADDHGRHTFAAVLSTPGVQSIIATDVIDGTIFDTLGIVVL